MSLVPTAALAEMTTDVGLRICDTTAFAGMALFGVFVPGAKELTFIPMVRFAVVVNPVIVVLTAVVTFGIVTVGFGTPITVTCGAELPFAEGTGATVATPISELEPMLIFWVAALRSC